MKTAIPTYQYDLVVYIGRFQPFHNAHKNLIKRASLLAPAVLILVGSADAAPNIKNPWSYEERKDMIENSLTHITADVSVEPVRDYTYNISNWIEEVANIVERVQYIKSLGYRVAVIGHDKDESSFYLNYFKQWSYVSAPAYPEHGETIDATKIRRLYFENNLAFIEAVVSPGVFKSLKIEKINNVKAALQEEYKHVEEYKKSWSVAPYEPTFVTVDSVVVQSGQVLLIQRGGQPGFGQWAIPGGFLDPKETLRDASVRELMEETQIKLQKKILERAIVSSEVFDEPARSTRGRTITHAFLYHLDDGEKLPRIKGSDDAAKAEWFTFAEFEKMRPVMYEDHWHIVQSMLNKI